MDKQKLFFALAVLVVAGLIVLFFTLFYHPKNNININLSNNDKSVVVSGNNILNGATTSTSTISFIPINTQTDLDVKQLAMSFAERYGSFSNQANFSNFSELKSFMTLGMQARVSGVIKKTASSTAIYDGYNTRALSANIVKQDDKTGIANIMVVTQREHMQENATDKIYYQNILLTAIKINKEWKIDDAKWQ